MNVIPYRQTRALNAFLAASCPACLVICDPEIHAATLRLRQPLPRRDLPISNSGVKEFRNLLGDAENGKPAYLKKRTTP